MATQRRGCGRWRHRHPAVWPWRPPGAAAQRAGEQRRGRRRADARAGVQTRVRETATCTRRCGAQRGAIGASGVLCSLSFKLGRLTSSAGERGFACQTRLPTMEHWTLKGPADIHRKSWLMEQCARPKEMSSTQGRDHAAIDDTCGRPRAVKPAGRGPRPGVPDLRPPAGLRDHPRALRAQRHDLRSQLHRH